VPSKSAGHLCRLFASQDAWPMPGLVVQQVHIDRLPLILGHVSHCHLAHGFLTIVIALVPQAGCRGAVAQAVRRSASQLWVTCSLP